MLTRETIRIFLSGPFRIETAAGADITPKGAKNQALLALLATSPDLFRNRRWLEDKLWSDRCADQASASLRQALSELRRALGDAHLVLVADRQKVGLKRAEVLVELSPAGEPEFLEGIDIRDPEFADWLRNERHRQISLAPVPHDLFAAQGAGDAHRRALPPARRGERRATVVVLQKSRMVADGLALLEDLFIDGVALSLREALGVTVYTRRQTPDLPGTIVVCVQAMAGAGGERLLRARATEAETERLLWSGSSAGLGGFHGPDDLGLVQFCNQVIEVLGDAISLRTEGGPTLDVQVLQRLAVRKLWTMVPERLAEAEVLLNLADGMVPCGLNAARRAQIRTLQMIERHRGDAQVLREEAVALTRIALERDPNNSMVLAVTAYVRCVTDPTPAYGAELARRSVRLNPNNPLAWDSLSYARLHAGQISEAHEIALRVQRIGAASPNKFWWDMGLCLTAAVTGNTRLALEMAESSLAGAPDFRAALRHVVALSAGADRPEAAVDAARNLQRLEEDFSIDALAHDPAYPVGVLRRSGILQSDRIMSIVG